MKKNKNILNKYFLLFVGVVVFVVTAGIIKADATKNVTGWIWGGSDNGAGISSGLGWISTNNSNTVGSTVSYGVDVPASGNGDLSGYAWSENLGYIAFDNSNGYLTGCPDGNCTAKRVGDNIEGWARFVGIAADLGNAGGYQGWIKLNGTALDGSSYGVKIAPDKKLYGYAWSDEMGAISFNGSTYYATLPPPPDVTFGTSRVIDLDIVSLPQNVTLTWSATNGPTSCTMNSTNDSLWASGSVAAPGGSISLTITAANTDGTFNLFCTNAAGDSLTKTVTITTGCRVKKCNLGAQICGKDSSGIFDEVSVSSSAACASSTKKECNSDSDCKPRSVLKWIESSL
ncbi:MAG: hypothetical protein WCI36_02430 [bacterium]